MISELWRLGRELKDSLSEKKTTYDRIKKAAKDNDKLLKEARENIKGYKRLTRSIYLEDIQQRLFNLILNKRIVYPVVIALAGSALVYSTVSSIDKIREWKRADQKAAYAPVLHSEVPNPEGEKQITETRLKKSLPEKIPAEKESLETVIKKAEIQSAPERQIHQKEKTEKNAYKKDRGRNIIAEFNYTYLSKPSDWLYFIVRGDTLSGISEDVTGSMSNWREIQKYNSLDSELIEVNQVLKIPKDLAWNKYRLSRARLVKENQYDSRHIPYRYITAKKGDSFSSISGKLSGKLFGRADHGEIIYRYNKDLNPRFSRRIWNNEHIFIPPLDYMRKNNGS